MSFISLPVLSTIMSDPTQLIPMLSGDNYKIWKDKMLLALGCMDLDLALRMDEPSILTELSTQSERTFMKNGSDLIA